MSEISRSFSTQVGLTRVDFGRRVVDCVGDLVDEVAGGGRLGLITSPSNVEHGHVAHLRSVLRGRMVAEFTDAVAHTPQEHVDRARILFADIDGIVALGGGGAIGLGKALAVDTSLPLTVIPTTYSGSEMTSIFGVTSGATKRVMRDPCAQPRLVIYDPTLSRTLPRQTARASMMNCLAHCFEAAWLPNPSPLALIAGAAVCDIVSGLVSELGVGGYERAADEAMLAGWLGGVALAAAGVGIEHTLCHVLGGVTRTSHGALHAIVLPRVSTLYEMANRQELNPLTTVLARGLTGADSRPPAAVLDQLCSEWEMPRQLSDVYDDEVDWGAVVRDVLASPAMEHPDRSPSADDVRALVRSIA